MSGSDWARMSWWPPCRVGARRAARGVLTGVLVVLVVPLVDSVLPLTGCIPPPAMAFAWTTDAPDRAPFGYPAGSELVELTRADGSRLVGVFAPGDPGAPVVLHLLGAGFSALRFWGLPSVYGELAVDGFGSLVVDWDGVGASDGWGDVRRMDEDVQLVWREAVRRAGGAERVIVRGASFGALGAAELLAQGERPAAVVLVAPVRGESVIEHYGRVLLGDLGAWIADAWLQDLAQVDLAAELAGTRVPVLALCSSQDPLLPATEVDLLAEALDRPGGTLLVDPHPADEPAARDEEHVLGDHDTLIREAGSVFPQEREWLRMVLGELPWEVRLRDWLARRAAGLESPDPACHAALARLLMTRWDGLDAALEGALSSAAPVEALELLQHLAARRPYEPCVDETSVLAAWLDPWDPAGVLDVWVIGSGLRLIDQEERRIRPEHVLACLSGLLDWGPRGRVIEGADGDWVSGEAAYWMTWLGDKMLTSAFARIRDVRAVRRQVARMLFKTVHIPERIPDDGPDGDTIEVYVDGGWRRIDLVGALPGLSDARLAASVYATQAAYARADG